MKRLSIQRLQAGEPPSRQSPGRALVLILLGLAMAFSGASIRAQTCSAAASNVDFGSVSPIRGSAVDSTGTVSVTCTWPALLGGLTLYAHVCLSLGSGTGSTSLNPRALANGTQTMSFNLYKDAARSQIWGSIFNTTVGTPIAVATLKNPNTVTGGKASTAVTYYGRIAANQPAVPLVNSAATLYTNNFSGTHTALTVRFDATSASGSCNTTTASTFPFTAQAQVVNDCTISANNLNFGSTGVLSNPLQASSNLNVACTNGDAWKISLSAGGSGNMLSRRMQRVGGTDLVAYQLYTSAARSVIWGDGTGGTSMVSGTGTGLAQSVGVYGVVPVQATPQPGTYSDTIIATITF